MPDNYSIIYIHRIIKNLWLKIRTNWKQEKVLHVNIAMPAFSGALYRIPNEILAFHFSWLEAVKNGKSMKNDCSDLVENVLAFLGVLKPFKLWVRREASTDHKSEIQRKLVFSFPTSK